MTTPREICLIGLQRSGMHAVMNWIIEQTRGRFATYNDICGPHNLEKWRRDPPNLVGPHTTHLLYNCEDVPLVGLWERIEEASLVVEIDRDVYPAVWILLLRDPFNLFASRHHYGRLKRPGWQPCQLGNCTQEALGCWKEHARKFWRLRHSPVVPCPEGDFQFRKCPIGLFIPVSFNAWVSRWSYRKLLWEELRQWILSPEAYRDIEHEPYGDRGREKISSAGGGSSFDGTTFDGRASEMKVLERYREMTPGFYDDLFDEETFELAEAIFGMKPRR